MTSIQEVFLFILGVPVREWDRWGICHLGMCQIHVFEPVTWLSACNKKYKKSHAPLLMTRHKHAFTASNKQALSVFDILIETVKIDSFVSFKSI